MAGKGSRIRPWTGAEQCRLRKLHAEGWSAKQIAKETGRSADAVDRRRRELGLTVTGPRSPDAERARKRVLDMLREGMPACLVAARTGRTANGVRSIAQRAGVAITRQRAPFWTEDELEILRQTEDTREAAAATGRTAHAVRMKRARLTPPASEPAGGA